MSGVLDQILSASTVWILVVVGLVVLVEDALFVGFVIPGETVAILGGVAAKLGHVDLWAVMLVVVLAAIIGDTIGFEVGRHLGTRILGWKVLEKRRTKLDAARSFLARRGGWAVFLGRWTAFFRAVMPALAGTSGMPYRTFATFNVAGGVAWGIVAVGAGYLAGASYASVEKVLGRDVAIVVVVVVLVAWGGWHLRHRRRSGPEDDRGPR